jgi:hypothetical protein
MNCSLEEKKIILSFLPKKCYKFVALNKEWQEIYLEVNKNKETSLYKNLSLNNLKYYLETHELKNININKIVSKGNLECLKYLHENDCHWDKVVCESAAANGHLDCLKYLHENDCPWDINTFSTVTLNGLKYAYKNSYSLDKKKYLDCLKYFYIKMVVN